jgi:hypothetical protein
MKGEIGGRVWHVTPLQIGRRSDQKAIQHGQSARAEPGVFELAETDRDVGILKNDLPAFNADPSWVLPMPARYGIGTDGVIAYAEVNPDYTHRPDPSELLPILDRLKTSRAA